MTVTEYAREFSAMGTTGVIRLWLPESPVGDEVLTVLVDRVRMLERSWTRFDEQSELSRLNATAGHGLAVPVSDDMLILVERMLDGYRMSGGLFNPMAGKAVAAHGYDRTFASLPAIGAAVDVPWGALGSFSGVAVNREERTVLLPAGVSIDSGGIGKGLAGDLLLGELQASGLPLVGALVDLGGDIVLSGSPGDAESWVVNVRNEKSPAGAVAVLSVPSTPFGQVVGVATSTVLARAWRTGDQLRHHVIDPATSQPSDTRTLQVTAVAGAGWVAEVAAKTGLLLNTAGPSWVREHELDGLFVFSDGVTATVGESVVWVSGGSAGGE